VAGELRTARSGDGTPDGGETRPRPGLSAAALLGLFPLFVVLGTLIKLTSAGPVFFAQRRVGHQERIFTMLSSVPWSSTPLPQRWGGIRARLRRGDGHERHKGHCSPLPIYRRSVPYGTVREHGLYFVAFSADVRRYDVMLSRMFGTAGDGLHDNLTDFSRPVSGAYYFAPALTLLAELAETGAVPSRIPAALAAR
jgi:hypothetical protein